MWSRVRPLCIQNVTVSRSIVLSYLPANLCTGWVTMRWQPLEGALLKKPSWAPGFCICLSIDKEQNWVMQCVMADLALTIDVPGKSTSGMFAPATWPQLAPTVGKMPHGNSSFLKDDAHCPRRCRSWFQGCLRIVSRKVGRLQTAGLWQGCMSLWWRPRLIHNAFKSHSGTISVTRSDKSN